MVQINWSESKLIDYSIVFAIALLLLLSVRVAMASVLVFSLRAGGGHVAAAQAVKENLQDEHEVNVISFEEVFKTIDPIALLTLKRYSITDFYNFFIKKKINPALNSLALFNYLTYPLFAYSYKRLIRLCLDTHQPDIIISVAPLLNGAIAQVAQEKNVPFVIVPTDLNTAWCSCYLSPLNQNTVFTIPFDEPEIRQSLTKANINTEYVQVTGFPVKQSFHLSKDRAVIKKEFQVPDGKPVVLLLMGSQGSAATFNYYKQLSTIDIPIHLLVCLGKNEELRGSLKEIPLANGVTVSIIGFTDRVADLMALADVCITKPGTVSVCEALYMNLPIICDNTSMSLFWEKFNLAFIKRHQFGDVVTKYSQVNSVLKKYLSDPEYLATIKSNISLFNRPNFGIHINNLVTNLLKEPS